MSSPNVLGPDKWFADGIHGDVLLCDPFNGRPLIAGGLRVPPAPFREDMELGGGYGFLHGAHELNQGSLGIGVLLTEPSDPNGLGNLADLRENMGYFSAVGYANKRSIRREAMVNGVAPGIGSVTVSGEIVPDDKYMETLLGVAAEQNKETFSFDPSTTIFGEPDGTSAQTLRKVEDAVRVMAVEQDPADADAALLGTDIVYSNTLQWHHVGRFGNEQIRMLGEYGMIAPSVLLVVPAEHGDLGRKLQASSTSQVDTLFARPEFAEIPEATSYPMAMEHGFIPGSALR